MPLLEPCGLGRFLELGFICKDTQMEIGKLKLSRKAGESILIGNDIVVTVARLTDSRVQLLVTAPRDVTILRSEMVKKTEVLS